MDRACSDKNDAFSVFRFLRHAQSPLPRYQLSSAKPPLLTRMLMKADTVIIVAGRSASWTGVVGCMLRAAGKSNRFAISTLHACHFIYVWMRSCRIKAHQGSQHAKVLVPTESSGAPSTTPTTPSHPACPASMPATVSLHTASAADASTIL